MSQLMFSFQCFLYCLSIVFNGWQLEEPNIKIQETLIMPDDTIIVATDIGIYRIEQEDGQFVYFIENVLDLANSFQQPQLVYALSTNYYESFVMRSEDGGISWKKIPLEKRAKCLFVDPYSPNILYVGFDDKPFLLKSTDGGYTWTDSANGIPLCAPDSDIQYTTDIYQITGSSHYLYSIFQASYDGLAVSTEQGESWELATLPEGVKSLEDKILQVPNPDTPKVAYTRTEKSLYRTTDGGYKWEQISSRPGTIEDYTVNPSNPRYQFLIQWAPRGTKRRILLYISEDEGRNWKEIPFPSVSTSYIDKVNIYPSLKDMNSFYLTLTSGYIAVSHDKGLSWEQLYNQPLRNYQLGSIGITDYGWILSGRNLVSRDTELVWKSSNSNEFEVVSSQIGFNRFFLNSEKSYIVYAQRGNDKLYRSRDGGKTWVKLPINLTDFGLSDDYIYYDHLFSMVPGNPEHIFAVEKGGWAESYDQGETWKFKPTQWQILQLVVTADAKKLYAIVGQDEKPFESDNKTSLFRSRNGGETWNDMHFRELAYGLPNFIAVCPNRSGYLYVNTSQGFFISTDYGVSWKCISELGHLDILRFLFHPVLKDKIYLAAISKDRSRNRKSIFTSDNAGRTWRDISPEFMSITFDSDIVIEPITPYSLYVLTGNDIWSYTEENAQVYREFNIEYPFELLPNYPNPVNKGTWIPYILKKDGNISIKIYDMQGRNIRTIYSGTQFSGIYQSHDKAFYWNGRDKDGELVANGVYFYTLCFNGQSLSRKLFVSKR